MAVLTTPKDRQSPLRSGHYRIVRGPTPLELIRIPEPPFLHPIGLVVERSGRKQSVAVLPSHISLDDGAGIAFSFQGKIHGSLGDWAVHGTYRKGIGTLVVDEFISVLTPKL